MNFLRSKKWILAALASGALFLAFLNVFHKSPPPSAPLVAEKTITNDATQIALKDTDGDGLKDWEESLWKTDPRNPDTDGDDTSDGQEVKAGRDPLKKGPHDALPKSVTAPAMASAQTISATESLAEQVFANYVLLKQSGSALDTSASKALVQAAIATAPQYSLPKNFTRDDLTVSTDESVSALRTYGNALGAIITRYGKPDVDQEMVIVYEALETNNPKKLNDLKIIVSSYQNVIAALLKVPVPTNAVTAHLTLLNSAAQTESAIAAMESVFSDPIIALQGFKLYDTSSQNLAVALSTLSAYMQTHHITFASYEAGSAFFTP